MSKGAPASYHLLNVLLLESSYKRDINVDIDDPELETDINIDFDTQQTDKRILITITLDFNIGKKEVKAIDSKISMLGIFEFSDNTILPPEEFKETNGPAIIFPFIREHLATVSMKSGIGPILLPPMNLKKMAEEMKKAKQ